MRLHLGAGVYYWPGFVNVDLVGDQDIVSDVKKLDLEDDSADEIHAIHILEHIHRMEADDVLKEWRRVLKKGGKLVLELPCLTKIAKLIVNGEKNMRLTLLGLYGDPREKKPYMEHKWGWSEEELGASLIEAGFRDIEFLSPVFHLEARDMRVTGV
jgi:ubiquinone/menaquinone biosynthesis C-methylase UbiE